jgi:paraquat-inducible protein B
VAEDAGELAVLTVHQRRRHPSLVWLLPMVALLIGAWLVYQSFSNRGPTITVRFRSAEGLEVGKTKIRYKDVDVGVVKAIGLSSDHKTVVVTAALVKSATDLLVTDSRFFVVKPRISGGTVSGLETLLSGAFIGLDVGSSMSEERDFVGLEAPPPVTSDSVGREFVLHGEQIGSLDVGSPVYFRRIKSGHVTQYSLDKNGKGVTVRLFVDSPYDSYVTENTRFWQASGVDVTLDANGFRLTTESLAAVLEGGLAFEDRSDAVGAPASAVSGSSFTLFADREHAMRAPDTEVQTYLMYFSESLRGLSPGAPVDLRGIVIGEVKSLNVEYAKGRQALRFPVEISIFPSRLRSRVRPGKAAPVQNEASERQFIDRLFASGMRGQLKTDNLLTGQLFIALDYFPGEPPAAMDWSASPPVMPTVAGGLTELQETVGRIAKKIDRIPLDKLSGELVQAVESLNKTLTGTERLVVRLDGEVAPEATATLREARETLAGAKDVLNSGSPVQQDVHEALKQVGRSARSLAVLTDMLAQHPESLIFGKKESGK